MIKSYKSKKIEKFASGDKSKIAQDHEKAIRLILNALDTATCINDLDLPGKRLHSFKEKTPVQWSLDVSGNWRIVFEFDGNDVYNVDYKDTH